MNKIVPLIMYLLKTQSSRIVMYFFAGCLVGNWVGAYYPKQSLAFWVQPAVALIIAVVTFVATMRSNQEQAIKTVVAQFTEPSAPPTAKESAILAKAGVELPK